MLSFVAILSLLVFVFVLAVISIILLDFKLQWHFFAPKESEIAFIVSGEKLERAVVTVPAKDNAEIVKALEDRVIKVTTKPSFAGLYFVGLLFPLTHVYEFQIKAEGIKDGSKGKEKPGENAPLRDWIYYEPRKVKGLRSNFPRPVLLENVELEDGSKVDIIVMLMLEVKDPYIPVFRYKGNFFEPIATFVKAAVIDSVIDIETEDDKDTTYVDFLKAEKGEGSEFAKKIEDKINYGISSASGSDSTKGIVDQLGICATSAFIYDFDLSPGQDDIRAAAKAEEIAERLGSAAVITAIKNNEVKVKNADGDALEIIKKGAATARVQKVTGLVGAKVKKANELAVIDPLKDQSAEVIDAIKHIKGKEGLPRTLTHYTEVHGEKPTLMLPINNDSEKADDKNKDGEK